MTDIPGTMFLKGTSWHYGYYLYRCRFASPLKKTYYGFKRAVGMLIEHIGQDICVKTKIATVYSNAYTLTQTRHTAYSGAKRGGEAARLANKTAWF